MRSRVGSSKLLLMAWSFCRPAPLQVPTKSHCPGWWQSWDCPTASWPDVHCSTLPCCLPRKGHRRGRGEPGPSCPCLSVPFSFCLLCLFTHTCQRLVSDFCASLAQAPLWQRYQDGNISDFSLFWAHRRPTSHVGGTYKGGASLCL